MKPIFVGFTGFQGLGDLTSTSHCRPELAVYARSQSDTELHGAWCGHTTVDAFNDEFSDIKNVNSMIMKTPPKVVVLATGFNDMNPGVESGGNQTASVAIDRMTNMIDLQLTTFPQSTVYVCTVIKSQRVVLQERIPEYNNLLKALVAKKNNEYRNRVFLLDFNSVSTYDGTWDGTHPTKAQAARMGNFAFQVITGIKPWTPNQQ